MPPPNNRDRNTAFICFRVYRNSSDVDIDGQATAFARPMLMQNVISVSIGISVQRLFAAQPPAMRRSWSVTGWTAVPVAVGVTGSRRSHGLRLRFGVSIRSLDSGRSVRLLHELPHFVRSGH